MKQNVTPNCMTKRKQMENIFENKTQLFPFREFVKFVSATYSTVNMLSSLEVESLNLNAQEDLTLSRKIYYKLTVTYCT